MKLKLIYNPYSGHKTFKNNLDICIEIFQKCGYEVHVFRSVEAGDIDSHISKMDKHEYDAIVVSGGDGTVNIVINALKKYEIKLPMGIIPSGTANDFATHLKIPEDPAKAAEVIANGKTMCADIGVANGKYFINVCAAGLMACISQVVDPNLKSMFGKLAYYIKGIEQLPNFEPLTMRITNSKGVIEDELYFFIVLNSRGTGGFENLSPKAAIDDGELDFIGFKAVSVVELAKLFVKVLKAEYLDDDSIIFFTDNNIKVEYINDKKAELDLICTDLDGEKGPEMPLEISILPKSQEIFIP